MKFVCRRIFINEHCKIGREEHDRKNHGKAKFICSNTVKNMAKDRYIWCLQMNRRLFALQIVMLTYLLTYSMAQQPLKSYYRPLMRVSLFNSILVTLIFYQRGRGMGPSPHEKTRQELRYYKDVNMPIEFCSEVYFSRLEVL